jgi:arylsulfatase A-like enzyme
MKPFFIYIAFGHMHVPVVLSSKYRNSTTKGILGDALHELDDSVGIILDTLEGTNSSSNTLILLTGDNGPPEDQCDWGGSKGPFMGAWQKTGQKGGSAGKLTSWEGGHREVGVAYWPGYIQPNLVSHALSSTLDFVPTVMALAGECMYRHMNKYEYV